MEAALIHPIILSGGSGTRLWPFSRELYPKQLLHLIGDGSLLQQTVLRLAGLDGVADPLIVCNEEHRFLIGEQLQQVGARAASILLEPVGRNTCPAAAIAALTLLKRADDAVVLVMPADHVIRDKAAFHASVRAALPLAQDGHLVTFGIVPTGPSTAYGYIRRGEAHRVLEFVEKPDATTAQRYLASGDFLWNSGMFLMRASVFLEEVERFAPDILRQCRAACARARQDGEFFRIDAAAFAACKGDSIDYAVMEKTERAAVVPLDAGWSDVGAWSTVWEVLQHDGDGNVVQGDVCLHDVRNTLAVAQHRFVAVLGVDNLIVAETADAVLIANKESAQNVRSIVDKLKAQRRAEHISHRRVYRPWGSYEGLDTGERFQVKRLIVKPGGALSLQMHYHRAEHWVVVKGTARVTRGDEVFLLTENQSTFIPPGTKHRLENPGTIPLEIVEVQSGAYLGEDDIVRFADNYDRANVVAIS